MYSEKAKKVLISVFSKERLLEFANELIKLNVEIIATEGTARELIKHNIPITNVSEFVGMPELLGGRVKTLHPKIHAEILKGEIDIVVVNLIPFESIEKMDVGGVAVLKSAIKNYEKVVVIVNPQRYKEIISEIKERGDLSYITRLRLAVEAAENIADYEARIYKSLKEKLEKENLSSALESLTPDPAASSVGRFCEAKSDSSIGRCAESTSERPSGTRPTSVNRQISEILYKTLKEDLSYREIKELLGEDADDVLLIANQKRLLLSSRNLYWESSLTTASEEYKMPNVIRYAVEKACETGNWEPEYAISAYFKLIKEAFWRKMPKLFGRIKEETENEKISAAQINEIATEFDMNVGVLIAEMKGAGLISPCVIPGKREIFYEVNPSL
jgi:hypothetical protein